MQHQIPQWTVIRMLYVNHHLTVPCAAMTLRSEIESMLELRLFARHTRTFAPIFLLKLGFVGRDHG